MQVFDLKFSVPVFEVLLEGRVSQICNLGLSFDCMPKKQVTFLYFLKLNFLDFIK